MFHVKHWKEERKMKNKLNVPKKYRKYFESLEMENGLGDNCKYMLYFANGYGYMGEYSCVPVRSKKEALYFLKSAMELA